MPPSRLMLRAQRGNTRHRAASRWRSEGSGGWQLAAVEELSYRVPGPWHLCLLLDSHNESTLRLSRW